MRHRLVAATALLVAIVSLHAGAAGTVRLTSTGGDPASGVARAVVVEEGALVHTAIVYPGDRGGPVASGPAAQAAATLDALEIVLKEAGTSLDHLVRLHAYVADSSVTPAVDALLARRFGGRAVRPALTVVESAMPASGTLVAMDAVAATAASPDAAPRRLTAPGLTRRTPRASHAAIQPPGPFTIVSGRAAPGEFDAAIRDTMAQLRGDLTTAGLSPDRVVQVKAFLGDMRRAVRLEEVIAETFPGTSAPPLVVTEWRQDAVPAEIELVAAGGPAAASRAAVEHIEPILGRYSRVARAGAGRLVFLSGLHGTSADPVAQVDEMFNGLQALLRETGTDIRHLVKATYYVSDKGADDRINAIRPTIYDPQHPPAASKLTVRGTGRQGRASTFDMIAVTSR